MFVTHFGKYASPVGGGMEIFLFTLCRGLMARRVACEVIVSQDTGTGQEYRDLGVAVRCLRSFGEFKSLPLCPGGLLALTGCHADIVHLHHPNPLADLAYLVGRPRARLVVTYHSDIVTQRGWAAVHRPLLHWILSRAAAIVATSPQYVDSSPVLSRFREKVTIIPLGIDPPPAEWLARPWPRPSGEPVFLFLGRLVPYKGVEVLLRALTQVPGRLWVAGSGPLKESLRRLAQGLGVAHRVEYLGRVTEEEKWRRLAACDAVVLPSRTRAEAFGIVLLEAMAAGRPVVASDLPSGVRLLVQEGINGFLVPPGDDQALAAALRRIASHPEEARELGAAGRELFQRHYTADTMVANYYHLYQRLI
ncbi:MAG: glycosyltransferase [Syntrophobacterales bacterium]|nr:glycosyltransferase [Syntrophobacterales bacterium]